MNRFWIATALALVCLASLSACAHTGRDAGKPGASAPAGPSGADALEDDPILHAFDPPPEKAPPEEAGEAPPPPAADAASADELDQKAETEDLLLGTVEPREPEDAGAAEEVGARERDEAAPPDEVIREDPILSEIEGQVDRKAERDKRKAEKAKRKAEKKAKKKERKDPEDDGKEDLPYEDDLRG